MTLSGNEKRALRDAWSPPYAFSASPDHPSAFDHLARTLPGSIATRYAIDAADLLDRLAHCGTLQRVTLVLGMQYVLAHPDTEHDGLLSSINLAL